MALYLALSCLQGRPARASVEELLELEPDGIQLTPGNYPDRYFQEWFLGLGIPYKLHHGFDWKFRKRPVWGDFGECVALEGATVHPPKLTNAGNPLAAFWSGRVLETMYPPYVLGYGSHVASAMAQKIKLAVDVAHIELQVQHGTMPLFGWEELQNYEHIEEIHVSQSHKGKDAHKPLTRNSFGLEWAKKHPAPKVLECYMHRLSKAERRQQMELVRGR